MRRVLAIAKATLIESLRDRVLYGILLCAGGIILAFYALSDWVDLGEQHKFFRDGVTAALSFFGLVLSIFLGVGLVSKEIERRSVYWLLVKPISRYQVVLGKYLGLVGLLLLDFLVLGAITILFLRALEHTWSPSYALLILLLFLKYTVVVTVALVFSTISGQVLSAILTFLVYIVGHSTRELVELASGDGAVGAAWVTYPIARAAAWLFPDLARLSFHPRILHNLTIPPAELLGSVAYGALYSLAALGVAALIFSRREFE